MNNIILPKCPICKRTKLVQLCLNCMAKEIKKARQEEQKRVFDVFCKRLHWFEKITIFKNGKPIYFDINKDVIEKVFKKLNERETK